MKYVLKPLISVGNYEFGANAKDYLRKKDYWLYYPPYKNLKTEDYEDERDGIKLGVENGKIISISCRKECVYQGVNLIGMFIDEFIKQFNVTPDEIDKLWVSEKEQQEVYNFEKLGIMLWINDEGIIKMVDAFGNEDE